MSARSAAVNSAGLFILIYRAPVPMFLAGLCANDMPVSLSRSHTTLLDPD